MFQEYKKGFKLGVAEITTEGVKQVEIIEFPEIEEDCIEIPAYDFTEKDYLEYKKKRNERIYRKFEEERWQDCVVCVDKEKKKANFIIVKRQRNTILFVEVAIDYTKRNIKEYGEKGNEQNVPSNNKMYRL